MQGISLVQPPINDHDTWGTPIDAELPRTVDVKDGAAFRGVRLYDSYIYSDTVYTAGKSAFYEGTDNMYFSLVYDTDVTECILNGNQCIINIDYSRTYKQ